MADTFVIVFEINRSPVAVSYLNYFGQDTSESAPQQTPFNPHFIGRFSAPVFARLRPFGAVPDAVVAQAPFNPHFAGRFAAPVFARLQYFNSAADTLAVTQAPFNNPHFVGRFTQPSFARLPLISSTNDQTGDSYTTPATIVYNVPRAPITVTSRLNFVPATDVPSVVVQTSFNPNFLARFNQPQFARPVLSQANTTPIQVPFNPHFLGRFSQPQFARPVLS